MPPPRHHLAHGWERKGGVRGSQQSRGSEQCTTIARLRSSVGPAARDLRIFQCWLAIHALPNPAQHAAGEPGGGARWAAPGDPAPDCRQAVHLHPPKAALCHYTPVSLSWKRTLGRPWRSSASAAGLCARRYSAGYVKHSPVLNSTSRTCWGGAQCEILSSVNLIQWNGSVLQARPQPQPMHDAVPLTRQPPSLKAFPPCRRCDT